MKQSKLLAAIGVLLILVGTIVATSYVIFNQEEPRKKFYVGVTYCGESIQEAKQLIDKVKNYTNIFILQSGPLMSNIEAIKEIGDYACASNLNYAVYGSKSTAYLINSWIIEAKERWGEQFIGIYYNDEPGGNMLDELETILETTVGNDAKTIQKTHKGTITIQYNIYNDNEAYNVFSTYYPDGRITVEKDYPTEIIEQKVISSEEIQFTDNITFTNTLISSKSLKEITEYHPNGTITIQETTSEAIVQYMHEIEGIINTQTLDEKYNFNFYTTENNITKYPNPIQTYEQVLEQNPVRTVDDAAKMFVDMNKKILEDINKAKLNEESIIVFTSDYGLYWWDYQSGYDVILAQLGWNHTTAQDIGLLRGAANLQNKSWGTIITWKYTHPPYLPDGKEMFEQMKASYQAGAQYVIIFNYSEDREKPNTLQEEHFQALELFWSDVVQNSRVKHGSIKAEAVLVLPQNYGWGMRHPNDKIWGIWPADDTSQTIWNQLQNKLDTHGLKIDIVYEDPNHPVAGRYNNVYYWNGK